jgi:hypothetical protein
MNSFDTFAYQLWEEAKRFNEKAIDSIDPSAKEPFFHATILIGMSALEAYINGICEDLLTNPNIPIHEQSILYEKEIQFDSGEFKIGEKLQMYRLTDRIEFLFFKFSRIKINGTTHPWYGNLKASIKLRNSLVHPKESVRVTESNTNILLESVKECLQQISKIVYGKEFPFVKLELQSKLTF